MLLATDVDYRSDGLAVSAGLLFPDWRSDEVTLEVTAMATVPSSYQPGQFYLRELPCLLELMKQLDQIPRTIIVDGYATLGAEARPGLGAHLFNALGGTVPVVGVAKTRFRGTLPEAEILRGRSKHPLFVTAIGMAPSDACAHVRSMHGPYRIPTLLARVDRLCRSA